MNKAVLLLGSNLGDKERNILDALNSINQKVGEIKQKSDLLKTTPEDYESDNYYLNLGVVVETNLSPMQLLKSVKEIEYHLGRTKDSSVSGKYEDRLIDIDIVFFNALNFQSKKLTIPHLAHTSKRTFSKKILYDLT